MKNSKLDKLIEDYYKNKQYMSDLSDALHRAQESGNKDLAEEIKYELLQAEREGNILWSLIQRNKK